MTEYEGIFDVLLGHGMGMGLELFCEIPGDEIRHRGLTAMLEAKAVLAWGRKLALIGVPWREGWRGGLDNRSYCVFGVEECLMSTTRADERQRNQTRFLQRDTLFTVESVL